GHFLFGLVLTLACRYKPDLPLSALAVVARSREGGQRRWPAVICGPGEGRAGSVGVRRPWGPGTFVPGGGLMPGRPVWGRILDDEALTRGLGDPEARVLVEWLVDRADRMAGASEDAAVAVLCRRGRAIACFVRLWCHERNRGAAI